MSDSEGAEVLRQWIKEVEEKCRECNHMKMSHSYLGKKCNELLRTESPFLCNCQEFVPSDNLDYVEWLAKKKGLVQ